ncbi:MAG: nucleotidyltransferase domain-containing protein [Pseudomonadota bacterium]
MRLTDEQQTTIRRTAEELFGPAARVSLFGSRVDDTKRGGDIDLLVETDEVLDNRATTAARFAARLQRQLGDRRIDVIIIDPRTRQQPIHEVARSTGKPL